MRIIIINGPNLNLLGRRERDIYGDQDFTSYFEELQKKFPDHELVYFQSNHEGFIIDKLHETGFTYDGIVLNAGGYTHTSIAIADAVKAINAPCIEVHISNIYEREPFRHHSFLKSVCIHHIVGQGLRGYEEALLYFVKSSRIS